MATTPEDATSWPEVLARLEPGLSNLDYKNVPQVSLAISQRRLADADPRAEEWITAINKLTEQIKRVADSLDRVIQRGAIVTHNRGH